MIVRGWCFGSDGAPISAVRLRSGQFSSFGVVGLPRPDVPPALPDAPGERVGFEIRATLPAGPATIVLEARTAAGEWCEFASHATRIRPALWPRWLGGGSVTDLVALQMPTQMSHPPCPVRAERFPTLADSLKRPRFAIVTPSFQQGRFLGETMRGVLTQVGVECDYIVQDGGSTDGSIDVIRRFAADSQSPMAMPALLGSGRRRRQQTHLPWPQLADWASSADEGQADAIVRGFARTSGGPDDVMAWINSDDYYLPGAVGCVADFFARNPDVDVVYGHRILVNEESQEIGRWFLPNHDAEVLRLYDFIPQETLFWRRRIWERVGGLDPSLKFALDWDLLLRFQAAGARIVRLPRFLGCFRAHAAQKTSAAMHQVGQAEIDLLRTRANGREIPPAELEHHPRLISYLRRAAFIQFLWKRGVRAP